MWSSRGTCSAEKRRKKPKGNHSGKGGEAGARGTPEESTKTQNPFHPFVCSPFCGVATLRVLQTLCGKSVDLLPEELQGRGLPGGPSKPVLGVVPVRLEKYRSGAAAHRANSASMCVRRSSTDLVVLKRDCECSWKIHAINVSSKIRNPRGNPSVMGKGVQSFPVSCAHISFGHGRAT